LRWPGRRSKDVQVAIKEHLSPHQIEGVLQGWEDTLSINEN